MHDFVNPSHRLNMHSVAMLPAQTFATGRAEYVDEIRIRTAAKIAPAYIALRIVIPDCAPVIVPAGLDHCVIDRTNKQTAEGPVFIGPEVSEPFRDAPNDPGSQEIASSPLWTILDCDLFQVRVEIQEPVD